jgi:Fe-S-cluster containining protein
MNYYQHLLTEISVRETAVDCSRCSLDLKCCTYRPFIANFLVGGFIDSHVFNEELMHEWDFLILGLTPSIQYRKYFAKKGKWGFGTDATLLCTFFQKQTGQCKIWESRPTVCRTFFCKSSYAEAGAYYWKKAEEWTWHLEWSLLEDFLHHKGWTLEEVASAKEYLQDTVVTKSRTWPEEFFLKDLQQARQFYSEAKRYVDALSESDVMEAVGEKGRQLYQELLAEKVKLR